MRALDQRGQLLHAALGFAGCSMPSYDRALWTLRTWLDSWSGIGHVAVGTHRQGYDLRRFLHGLRARARSRRATTPTRVVPAGVSVTIGIVRIRWSTMRAIALIAGSTG